MKSTIHHASVSTSHGQIAVETAGGDGPVVLLIHGNSSYRGVFRKQMRSAIAGRARMIAFDLPGHGESSDAPDPERTYTRSGLAAAAVEVLAALSVDQAIVFGWSLGGHIAIEMIHRFPGMRGLTISGTPPVSDRGPSSLLLLKLVEDYAVYAMNITLSLTTLPNVVESNVKNVAGRFQQRRGRRQHASA